MKTKLHKNIAIIIFSFMTVFAFSQENSISPIFGIAESSTSFQNDLVSINQVLGDVLTVESFSNQNFVSSNFTVSNLISSNVDKLFLLENTNTLAVYDLPYFFDPNYSGEQSQVNLSFNINDLDYHKSSSLVYGYDLVSQELYSFTPNSGLLQSTSSLAFNSSIADFSLKTFDNYVVLCGNDNGLTKLLFKDLSNATDQTLTLTNQYNNFNIISDQLNNKLYAVATDLNLVNWLYEIDLVTQDITTISALPSCSNCSSENFLFDKNALAIDWENNELLMIMNEQINAIDNYYLLTIELTDGNLKYFSPLDNPVSNLYFNKSAADLVFPGDANHDGIVNTRDIIPIGLRYSMTVNPRFTQNIDWIGQHAFDKGIIAQGVDVKHADCNGDGQINAVDVDAIKANYSSVHNSNKSSSAASSDCDYPLDFSFSTTAYEDNDVSVNIKLGETFDIVTDVYAVSFTIYYDNQFVVPNSMHTIGMNSWFGNDGANCIHTSQDDHLNGKMDVTITGVDLLNRSGGGDIITAAWTIEDLVMPIAQLSADMDFRIEDVYIINLAEDEKESCGTDTSITVYHKDAVAINEVDKDQIAIYPNPTKELIHIDSKIEIETIQLLSVTGKIVKDQTFINHNAINVSSLSKGIYLLKLNSKDSSYYEKIIIQ